MKLNIGCGRNTKEGWINVDAYERENKLDVICDVTKKFPFENNSCEYIYAEQFIEHLEWIDGLRFLKNCFRVLKSKGILRLVLPDYKRIFKEYLDNNKEYFKIFFDELNEGDYPYYSKVYAYPNQVKEERKNNPPPEWHTSPRIRDRRRLELRVRYFKYIIDVVDWFVHQYSEHRCLYDFEKLEGMLKEIGFSEVKQTDIIKGFDSEAPSRITSSLYIEAIK